MELYIPIFSLVFGEAQLEGKAAIISWARPRGDTDRVMPPRPVYLRRLIKLSLPELGHTFALGHCRRDACIMGFPPIWKNLAFCGYCQVFLADYLRDHGLAH